MHLSRAKNGPTELWQELFGTWQRDNTHHVGGSRRRRGPHRQTAGQKGDTFPVWLLSRRWPCPAQEGGRSRICSGPRGDRGREKYLTFRVRGTRHVGRAKLSQAPRIGSCVTYRV